MCQAFHFRYKFVCFLECCTKYLQLRLQFRSFRRHYLAISPQFFPSPALICPQCAYFLILFYEKIPPGIYREGFKKTY